MLFGVGAAKTGTSSLAAVLRGAGIAAAHEPDCEQLIRLILERHAGHLSVGKFRAAVKDIVEAQALDANISQINGFIIEDILAIFPASKYILTIRDAESWALSFFNHANTRPLNSDNVWHRFRALRFNRDLPYGPGDDQLKRAGLQSLDSYLTYWLEHNLSVLSKVPESRLLMLSTASLNDDLGRIADFIGFEGTLSMEDAHENRGLYSNETLVEPDYLSERCQSFTTLLLERARHHISPPQMQTLGEIVTPAKQSYYAQSASRRIAQTESLKENQKTDIPRWKNVDLESDERWDGRARLAASMITGQLSVADLGCGSMLIEPYLEKNVLYIPIDVVRRDARTIVWDFNAQAAHLPSELEASCALALGLLEYIHDVPVLLSDMARRFRCVVCSYLPTDTSPSVEQRRATGWMNDYSTLELENIFVAAGFQVEQREVFREKTHLWRLGSV